MAAAVVLWCLLMIGISPWTVNAQSEGDVRLVGGSSASEGRVEIYHNNMWGTVCDDYWDDVDASVVCRQLGYNRALRATDRAYFGEGSGLTIWLDNVDCTGYESQLSYCSNRGWGVEDCSHSEDAGAICTNTPPSNGDIRLSDGLLLEEGRVEIYYNGQWGTICDDYWGYDEARVACYQLGYSGVTNSETSYGSGSGPIFMDDVFCYGYESALIYCSFDLNTGDCSHSEDVGIRCYRSGGGLSGWAISMIVISSVFVFGAVVLIISRICTSSKQRRRPTTTHNTGQTNVAYTTGGDITVTNTTVQPGYQSGMPPYPPQMMYPSAPPPSYSTIAGTAPYPPAAATAPPSQPQGALYNPTAAYPPEIPSQAAPNAPPVQEGDGTATNEPKYETVVGN